MKSAVKNYNQSPRKVRRIADTVQGKVVKDALLLLSTLDSKCAICLQKGIKNAVNSAAQSGKSNIENTYKVYIRVDKGIAIRRYTLLARGRTNQFRKTRAHISILLQEKTL